MVSNTPFLEYKVYSGQNIPVTWLRGGVARVLCFLGTMLNDKWRGGHSKVLGSVDGIAI